MASSRAGVASDVDPSQITLAAFRSEVGCADEVRLTLVLGVCGSDAKTSRGVGL